MGGWGGEVWGGEGGGGDGGIRWFIFSNKTYDNFGEIWYARGADCMYHNFESIPQKGQTFEQK